jgi:hypothetical protein
MASALVMATDLRTIRTGPGGAHPERSGGGRRASQTRRYSGAAFHKFLPGMADDYATAAVAATITLTPDRV